jgi:hypothetical protein
MRGIFWLGEKSLPSHELCSVGLIKWTVTCFGRILLLHCRRRQFFWQSFLTVCKFTRYRVLMTDLWIFSPYKPQIIWTSSFHLRLVPKMVFRLNFCMCFASVVRRSSYVLLLCDVTKHVLLLCDVTKLPVAYLQSSHTHTHNVTHCTVSRHV